MEVVNNYLGGYLNPQAFTEALTEDAVYMSPLEKCASRTDSVLALADQARHCDKIEIIKIFSHDNQVCAVYDLVSSAGKRRVVDLITLSGDKIQSIDQTFDATEVHRRNCEI